MVGSVESAGGDHGGAPAGQAGDRMNARGLEGLGQGQRRQDGSEAARQRGVPRARRTQQEDVMGSTPV
jgi:hypothetical protein